MCVCVCVCVCVCGLKRALEITLGVPKCYKLSSMPGFICNLCRSQPARMTLSILIFYCVVSYLVKMMFIFCNVYMIGCNSTNYIAT